jgi:hypothetical protein
MSIKVNSRRLKHNLGTHRERMTKRRAVQNLRSSQVLYRLGSRLGYNGPFVSVSKYNPSVEDKKHKESV